MYILCMNGYASRNVNKNNLVYNDGSPHTCRHITRFINSYRCSLFSANCLFKEYSNEKEFSMKRKSSRFILCMQYLVCFLVTFY